MLHYISVQILECFSILPHTSCGRFLYRLLACSTMADEGSLLDDNLSLNEFGSIQKEDRELQYKKSFKKSRHIFCLICAIICVVLLLCTSFGAGFILGWGIYESTEPAINLK